MANVPIIQPAGTAKLNYAHPLASSVLAVYNGTNTLEQLRFTAPSSDTSTSRVDQSNVVRAYNGSQLTTYPNSPVNGALSVLCVVSVDALTNYNPIIACQDTTTTNGYEIRLGAAGPTDTRIVVIKLAASGNIHQWQASATTNQIAAGEKNVAVVINLYADINVASEFYLKGNKITGVSLGTPTGSGNIVPSTQPIYIGSRSDAVTHLSGGIALLIPFNRTLSDFEAFSLIANPWQLFSTTQNIVNLMAGIVPQLPVATNDVWLYNTAIPSGNDVWLQTTRPAASSTVNYTLTASAGSYSYTGQSATLKSSRTLSAANGSYSYTGQPATLVYKRQITANQGTYNLTGQAATFSLAKKLTAASGSYSIAGQVATLKYARQITAASGTYNLSGQAATLTYKRQITSASGSYSYSGQTATFNYARQITAANGAYSYTGQAATFTYTPGGGGAVSYTLTAAVGSYAYTGQGATFVYSRKLVAAAGAYSYSGQSATLVKGRVLNATVGSYSYSGQSATFSFSRKLPASAGSYSYSGQAASFVFKRSLSALSGSYDYTGNIATFVYSRSIPANAGTYTYTGQAATLTFTGTSHYTLGCQPGSYSVTGYPASLTYTNNTPSTSSPAPDFGGGGGAFYRGGKSYELRRKDRTEKPKYDIIPVEQQDEEQEEEFIIAFVLSQIISTGHVNDG